MKSQAGPPGNVASECAAEGPGGPVRDETFCEIERRVLLRIVESELKWQRRKQLGENIAFAAFVVAMLIIWLVS